MRQSRLVAALAVALGTTMNGVCANLTPLPQGNEGGLRSLQPLQPLPSVGAGAGSDAQGQQEKAGGADASSAVGLVQLPGAQITSGQLVALPGATDAAATEATSAVVSSVAISTVSSVATSTSISVAISTSTSSVAVGATSSAVLESVALQTSSSTQAIVVATSSSLVQIATSQTLVALPTLSSAAPLQSLPQTSRAIQSFQIIPPGAATTSAVVVATTSAVVVGSGGLGVISSASAPALIALPSVASSQQGFQTITRGDVSSALVATASASSISSAAFVGGGALATSRFGSFPNATAALGPEATATAAPPNGTGAGLVALPNVGAAAPTGTLVALPGGSTPGALVPLPSSGSSTDGSSSSGSNNSGSGSGSGSGTSTDGSSDASENPTDTATAALASASAGLPNSDTQQQPLTPVRSDGARVGGALAATLVAGLVGMLSLAAL
ncbi:hypothetical protein GGS23DRAFT_21769 [Durotheca rogersii]|uniref:uncharacterized protein n=1 Tax=Durotheca rogersii TaxID=419775 RepID=UPI0022208EDD|nr:uncharacterized protein GGS23DRAFT_21769 [Durotheca rogersii]KAI5868317.1 hypothetical protein GGS23DRAFT_21769 [Durotheca rogersii]